MAEAPHAEPKKLGDFARPSYGITASAIVLSPEGRNYELKHTHVNMLPPFYGMPNEDALLFIREFGTAVQSIPLLNLSEDELLRKCFPYALKDRAKSWYLSLPAGLLPSWKDVSTTFLLKYYPNHKTQEIRLQIMQFAQEADESFHEALDRFRELQQQCPHHQIMPELLWQIFYNGLQHTFQFMVDTVAGGKISDKTGDEAVEIFETLAANSRQKTTRSKWVEIKEIGASSDVKKQVTDILVQLQELKMGKISPSVRHEQESNPCGVCGDPSHDENNCTRMGEMTYEGGADVFAAQGYQPHQPFDQNPSQQSMGWRSQNNPGWKGQNQGQGSGSNFPNRRSQQQFYPPQQQYQPHKGYYPPQQGYYPPQQQYYMPPPPFQPPAPAVARPTAPTKPSLEDSFAAFMQESKLAREAQEATIKRLEGQVGQISITVLRSGKQVDNQVRLPETVKETRREEKSREEVTAKEKSEVEKSAGQEPQVVRLHKSANPYKPPVPFPSRLRNVKLDQQFSDFYKMLSKVNVNLLFKT